MVQELEQNDIDEDPRKKLGIPKYIKIDMLERSFGNIACFVIYRLFRSFYVSFWFYFLPFTIILLSYAIPY